MIDKLRFNPLEGVKEDFESEEPTNTDALAKSPKSEVFFDPNGHNDAFEAHPLSWDSIVYRSSNK